MKKMVKLLLVLSLVVMFIFAPVLGGKDDVKYPDDRPICHFDKP